MIAVGTSVDEVSAPVVSAPPSAQPPILESLPHLDTLTTSAPTSPREPTQQIPTLSVSITSQPQIPVAFGTSALT